MKIECSEDIESAFGQAQGNLTREFLKIAREEHLSVAERVIDNGMRLLAKAGRRIDAAFCGRVVKRNFVIRDEILNRKTEEDVMIDKIREDFCRLMLS